MKTKSHYLIRLSGVNLGAGEYEGGKTLAEARAEAKTFASYRGKITIVQYAFGPAFAEDGTLVFSETIKQAVAS
jgi:hypothetical protein